MTADPVAPPAQIPLQMTTIAFSLVHREGEAPASAAEALDLIAGNKAVLGFAMPPMTTAISNAAALALATNPA